MDPENDFLLPRRVSAVIDPNGLLSFYLRLSQEVYVLLKVVRY